MASEIKYQKRAIKACKTLRDDFYDPSDLHKASVALDAIAGNLIALFKLKKFANSSPLLSDVLREISKQKDQTDIEKLIDSVERMIELADCTSYGELGEGDLETADSLREFIYESLKKLLAKWNDKSN